MVFARLESPRPLTLPRRVSMTIYSSTKAAPYVYICTHKETDQFYIGYRERNVKLNIPSHLDLPEYKTSSTTVRPDWENYTWNIVAEFFDPSHAYTFEQQLIFDNWKNPLLLNGHYNLGENHFRCTPESTKKSAASHQGKNLSAETRQKISDATKGIPRGPRSAESIKKGAASSKGKHCSAETRQKISDANRGKSSPLKGKPTGPNGRKGKPTGPHSAESKQKMSDAKKGKPTGPRPKVECPHCGKIGGGGAMEQWHFDNCKMKPID